VPTTPVFVQVGRPVVRTAKRASVRGLSLRAASRYRHATGDGLHEEAGATREGLAAWQMRRARELLAFACGFAGHSHFTRTFTATVGMSPGIWRRVHLQGRRSATV